MSLGCTGRGRRGGRTGLLCAGALATAIVTVAGAGAPPTTPDRPIASRLAEARAVAERVELRGVRLDDATTVDLDLSPLPIVAADVRFVVGSDERPVSYDASRVRAFRGAVAARPDQRAFIVVTPTATLGYVHLREGRRWISEGTTPTPATHVAGRTAAAPPPGLPLCGCDLHRTNAADAAMGGVAGGAPPGPMTPRVIRLAVETDYEFYSLIGDMDATLDYVLALYAADSDLFLTEAHARLELTFVRIWDTPDDLFNEEEPLGALVTYWNARMTSVERDVVQFLSGRRDLPWGGIAYLSALCTDYAYSIVAYALGFMPDLSTPSVYNYDVPVTAHELGHNFGANHTHAYGLDDCNLLNNTPQRGTIMGYCSQTVSGGNAVTDTRFGTIIAGIIRTYLSGTECGYVDCDGDGVADAEQIAAGQAADIDGNGVPDACQDCNANGVLDAAEIAAGTSADLDANGLPDECDPDCNGNDVPDALDIALSTSVDQHDDGVPDECEDDCDGDGTSDYTQLMADMSLDVNRNLVLDSCEDCDHNGVTDLAELDGAWNAWVASTASEGVVRRFHSITGVLTGASPAATTTNAKDLRITASGRILVASSADDRIVELARDGSVAGDFVPAGSGGLDDPSGIELGPDGHVYVTSRGTHSVLRYDGATGAFLGAAVPAGAGGLVLPWGLVFGPDGLLYVNCGDNQVRRYDVMSGASLGVFVAVGGNGGLLGPRGMLFLPDGDLLVASAATNSLLRYSGATGAFIGKWNQGGTASALTFDQPWCLRYGPNGNVYASRHLVQQTSGEAGGLFHDDLVKLHVNSSRIYEFEATTGLFLRSYVTGHDTELWFPSGFDFMPGDDRDCNRNGLPDSCELASQALHDVNGNGVPDECEEFTADLTGDGIVNSADLAILLGGWGPCPRTCPADLDGDGAVGAGDLGILLGAWG